MGVHAAKTTTLKPSRAVSAIRLSDSELADLDALVVCYGKKNGGEWSRSSVMRALIARAARAANINVKAPR